MNRAVLFAFAVLSLGACGDMRGPPTISANDNEVAAGRLRDSTLTLTLEARMGRWYPDEARREQPLLVAAFGLPRKAPSIPGPLIRVRSGTTIRVRLVNRLDSLPLTVHGLHTHPVTVGDSIQVPAGATREVVFAAGAPGTYFYWGSTNNQPIDDRSGTDSQLAGALVVDPATGPVPADRIFVIGLLDLNPIDAGPDDPFLPFAAAINGRSWPHTERMNLVEGDTVRWRWINASGDNHPMHLHGFYFRVDSRGTGSVDTIYEAAAQRQVVTERLNEGSTMAMTWSPERPGHWLMHCHFHFHAAADSNWGPDWPRARGAAAIAPGMHADDMAGLVLGINVDANGATAPERPASRHVRLLVEPAPQARIQVKQEEAGQAEQPATTPGAPLLLTRGETAEITVVNHLATPTAMHWHGIELDSYYDGVPGWGGSATRRSPMIAPGDSFVARMTPPRPGTFIYHAHNMATDQIGLGLVGPLIVLEPLEVRRAEDEIIWIVGGRDLFFMGHLELNGEEHPAPLTLRANRRYRVRLINITENNTADVTLGDAAGPARWRPIAKDAMPVSSAAMVVGPAEIRTTAGETFDFEFDTGSRRDLTLRVQNSGKPVASQEIEIR